MDRRTLALIVGALGAAIIGYAWFARETDEEKILGVLTQLAAAVRVDEDGQNPIFRLAQVNKHFSEIVAEDVTFRIPEYTGASRGRKSLAGLAAQIGPYFQRLDVDFKDVTVDLDPDHTKARVASNAVADGSSRNGPFKEERRVRAEMIQTDGDWRIQRLVVFPRGESEIDDEETDTQ
jgi:hypothetical protein